MEQLLQAHLMLADYAAAIGPKLFINGGGWALRPAEPIPWCLALEVRVPWTDNNRMLTFAIDLLDADGDPVEYETPEGLRPLNARGEMRLTAGPALKPGSSIVAVAAAYMQPIPLPPAERFTFKLTIDGKSRDEWCVAFGTMPARQPAS